MWELWGRKSTVRQVSEIRGESQNRLACAGKFFCQRLAVGGQLSHFAWSRLGTAVGVVRRSPVAQSRICHAVARVSG